MLKSIGWRPHLAADSWPTHDDRFARCADAIPRMPPSRPVTKLCALNPDLKMFSAHRPETLLEVDVAPGPRREVRRPVSRQSARLRTIGNSPAGPRFRNRPSKDIFPSTNDRASYFSTKSAISRRPVSRTRGRSLGPLLHHRHNGFLQLVPRSSGLSEYTVLLTS